MVKIISFIMALTFATCCQGQPDFKKFGKNADFIAEAYQYAEIVEFKYNIPVYLTLAVTILETGYGTSYICQTRNNYFGMNKGKTQYYNMAESFLNFGHILHSAKRYQPLKKVNRSNYREMCETLQRCGYNPYKNYTIKLIRIIEQYQLYKL